MGTALKVGYDFKVPGKHAAHTVSFVDAQATFWYSCVAGPLTPKRAKPSGSGAITVAIGDASYLNPANSSAWYPSGKQSDASVYQGSLVLPSNLCTANGLVRLQKAGRFSFTLTSTGNGERVYVRWHYGAGGSPGDWSDTLVVVPR
jgi:hypothetical protein